MTPAGLRKLDRLAARALRTRRIVRAPIWLYRHGLGFLLGTRVLMLEHVGRTTGLPRYVVLETVGHPDPDTFVVVSGFGAQAQWYRNVQHEPHVHVSVGRLRRAPADATAMTEAETERMLAEYARDHPRAWKRLRSVVEAAVDRPVDQLPMVRLRLRR